jgi:CheY-like chemotaxis protein
MDSDHEWVVEAGRIPVLVVEDDPADALVIERLLGGSLYQPLVARSVREARQIMQTLDPAAILLDVVLAGDESWRLLLELRDGEASRDIPLIVISSTGEDRKSMHLGADAYLPKPVDGDSLFDLLDRVTGRRSLTQVLLVDDEEVTHYLVRQLLPRAAYRLWIAHEGTDALDRLTDHSPDVILLDLSMPGMDGFEFLNRLRQEPSLKSLPVIVLSSAVLQPDEHARLLQAASLILSKSALAARVLIDAIDSVTRAEAAAGAA